MNHDQQMEALRLPNMPEVVVKRGTGVDAFADYGIAILDRDIAKVSSSPEVNNYETQRREALNVGNQALFDEANRLKQAQIHTPEVITAAEQIIVDEAKRLLMEARQNVTAAVNPLMRGSDQ